MRRHISVMTVALLLSAGLTAPAAAIGPPAGAGPPDGLPIDLPTVAVGTVTIEVWPQEVYCAWLELVCGFTATVDFAVRTRPDGSTVGTFNWWENGDRSTVYSWDLADDSALQTYTDGTRTFAWFQVVYQPTAGAVLDDILTDLADRWGVIPLEAGDLVMVSASDSNRR